ncbi:hypothetical protein [Microbacterium flavum]|uniref:Uncharacterized protein n=1 Tax=Microbacterium flavum TaxID=415216 RepID=A0ABS5XV25_9MICO|nr:hypothetical protein [Microbacterium flavum]MBT8798387.1 hypothetical protein [Microbacterium flavum]
MDAVALTMTALAAAGVVLLVAVIARAPRRGSADADRGGATVRAAGWIALAWAVISGVAAVYLILTTLLAPAVTMTIPVRTFWPQLPEGTTLEGPTATLEQGGFVSADVTLLHLSMTARVLWALSQALWCIVPGTIAALVAVAAFRLRAGHPFTPLLARGAGITAAVVALGGVAAQILGDIAGTIAAGELLRWSGAEYPDVPGIEDALHAWWPQPGYEIALPFWPIAAGFGFAALAAILRDGMRLQRDTEGLV